jgi:beta-lactam-binding protein with PASTA domain
VFGATLAGKIWQATMNSALSGTPVEQFTGPSSYYEIGITTAIPDVAGESPSAALAALKQAGFSPHLGTSVHSTQKLGTVAHTSPAAGSRASTGATITVFISDGTPPPAKQPKAGKSSPPASPPPSVPPTAKPKKHHPAGHHH